MTAGGIAQFVADRLDEMETSAKAEDCDSWHTKYCGNQSGSVMFGDCECDVPAGVLRQVAALRLIVGIHGVNHQCVPIPGLIGWTEQPCETMQVLASVWAGHPDYNTTWEQG